MRLYGWSWIGRLEGWSWIGIVIWTIVWPWIYKLGFDNANKYYRDRDSLILIHANSTSIVDNYKLSLYSSALFKVLVHHPNGQFWFKCMNDHKLTYTIALLDFAKKYIPSEPPLPEEKILELIAIYLTDICSVNQQLSRRRVIDYRRYSSS
jgi:hypothetical protein